MRLSTYKQPHGVHALGPDVARSPAVSPPVAAAGRARQEAPPPQRPASTWGCSGGQHARALWHRAYAAYCNKFLLGTGPRVILHPSYTRTDLRYAPYCGVGRGAVSHTTALGTARCVLHVFAAPCVVRHVQQRHQPPGLVALRRVQLRQPRDVQPPATRRRTKISSSRERDCTQPTPRSGLPTCQPPPLPTCASTHLNRLHSARKSGAASAPPWSSPARSPWAPHSWSNDSNAAEAEGQGYGTLVTTDIAAC